MKRSTPLPRDGRCGLGATCLVAVALLLGTSRSRAESSLELPLTLDRGLSIEGSSSRGVSVSRAGIRAPLIRTADFDGSVYPFGQGIRIGTTSGCWYFGEPLTTEFTLEMLEARLENVAALRLHRAKQYAEAAQGFRKALALDPRYELAAYNLASALSLSGKKEEAVAALGPLLKKSAVKVYLGILQDPELKPLLETSTLAALRADRPGKSTTLNPNPDSNWAAYSAKHDLLAAFDPHSGLIFFSVRAGNVVFKFEMGSDYLPYSCGDSDCYQDVAAARQKARARADAMFNKRLPAVRRLLSDLGFNEVAREEGRTCPDLGRDVCFFESAVQMTVNKEAALPAAVRKKGKLIFQSEYGMFHGSYKAAYFPQLDAILSHWDKASGSTECGRQAGTELFLLRTGKRAYVE